MFRLGRLSVFAVASCVVFVVTILQVAPSLGRGISFSVMVSGELNHLPLPFLWLILTFYHTLVAFRLYAHAWAADESKVLPAAMPEKTWFSNLEWLLRGAWVVLVSYLPTAFGSMANAQDPHRTLISAEVYYVFVFGLVVIWDLVMFRYVKTADVKFSFVNRQHDADLALSRYWLGIDIALFSLALALASTNYAWSGDYENWKPILFVLFLTITSALCIVQMALWIPEIKESALR